MQGNKFVSLVFGKFLFLLHWQNILSGSDALHFRFIRYKYITCTVISVNRPFIIWCISGKHAFYLLHVQYSGAVIVWLLRSSHEL